MTRDEQVQSALRKIGTKAASIPHTGRRVLRLTLIGRAQDIAAGRV